MFENLQVEIPGFPEIREREGILTSIRGQKGTPGFQCNKKRQNSRFYDRKKKIARSPKATILKRM
jgi:hypothetical protein